MKRLFYFTGYRLTVLHYKRKALVANVSFEPTEKGLDDFRKYLSQTDKISSKFLVDVIEEDFRTEKIPHVGARDRKSVIGRLVDRFYRSSQGYCYSDVIGREKEGRKDDVVLLGAITNPELIQPWINIIDECEVPLSGIWSLPLVSKKLLKQIKATSGNVLLVSQQVNSNVRQTLFKDGVLISSRQSIINQDINDISGVGELAAPEVNRTIEFLRVQNLIAVDAVINLHILGSDEQIESLQNSFKEDDQQTVTIHKIDNLLSEIGLTNVSDKFSDGIFSWLCASQKFIASHYGQRETFNRYRNTLVSKALYIASLVVMMYAVLATQSNISSAIEFEKSIVLLKNEERTYNALYDEKFKEFEAVFANSGVMNSAVVLADTIRENSAVSPLAFMISLSTILSNNNELSLSIDKIEWQAVTYDVAFEKYKTANFTDKQSVLHDAIVTGRIDVPEQNYRESVDHLQKIISAIEADEQIESVEALSLPVDMRSDSKFASESGAEAKVRSTKELTGVFILKIRMKAPENG